ncbi:hypothetical protein N9Y89_00800 [bacterium]|nr:hypothetical protein [bacterium]
MSLTWQPTSHPPILKKKARANSTQSGLDALFKEINKMEKKEIGSNEVVVEAFLKDKIGFLEMSDVIENCMEKSTFVAVPTYDDFVSTNEQSRMLANELIK